MSEAIPKPAAVRPAQRFLSGRWRASAALALVAIAAIPAAMAAAPQSETATPAPVAPIAGAASADPAELLRQADHLRLVSGEAQVRLRIRTLVDGVIDKEREYRVLIKPGRRSLVVSESPVEKGQKVLMLADDFWIILPSSERPVRITPVQKLLGDASVGDIANMTWSEDYEGRVLGEEAREGRDCRKLELVARNAGSTYKRIVLWLARDTAAPVHAEFYLASDRIAKEAGFRMGELGGRHQVVGMDLTDRIQTHRSTRIDYLEQTARTVPDTLLNPMNLVHARVP